MESNVFCQSCSLPLDKIEMRGTEKDGSKSLEYCKYCYQNGELINPKMTLEEMRQLVITKMEEAKVPKAIIEKTVTNLPNLKRWRKLQSVERPF